MNRRSLILLSICLAIGAGIAALAFAGYLLNNGDVNPDSGYVNETVFQYSVTYSLSPGENPPVVHVIGYLGGDEEWRAMMSIHDIQEVFVIYWFQTKLPYTGDWSFRFKVEGGGMSGEYPGPEVE